MFVCFFHFLKVPTYTLLPSDSFVDHMTGKALPTFQTRNTQWLSNKIKFGTNIHSEDKMNSNNVSYLPVFQGEC